MREVLEDKLRMAEDMYAGPVDLGKHKDAYRLPLEQKQSFRDQIDQYRIAVAWMRKFDRVPEAQRERMWQSIVNNRRAEQMSDVQIRVLNAAWDVINDGYISGVTAPRTVQEGSLLRIMKTFTSRRWKPEQVLPASLDAVDVAPAHITIPIRGNDGGGRLNIDVETLATHPDKAVHQYEVHFTKNVERFKAESPDADLHDVVLQALRQTVEDTKDWLNAARTEKHLTELQWKAARESVTDYYTKIHPDPKDRIKQLKNPESAKPFLKTLLVGSLTSVALSASSLALSAVNTSSHYSQGSGAHNTTGG